MELGLRVSLGVEYKSPSQVARVLTEDWAVRNLYCPACPSDSLTPSPTNTRAIDLSCPECKQPFQLKSGRGWNQTRIVDAAYESMLAAVRSDRVPNLVTIQYTSGWKVWNALLVPSLFFTETVIEKRKPLSAAARRAGWIGCNILLKRIPTDGKLRLVTDGVVASANRIRDQFDRIRPLSKLPVGLRGWTLDVLNAVRQIQKQEFTLAEVYAFETQLAAAHPGNRHVREKIRQQLQRLRDLRFLQFVSPSHYCVSR